MGIKFKRLNIVGNITMAFLSLLIELCHLITYGAGGLLDSLYRIGVGYFIIATPVYGIIFLLIALAWAFNGDKDESFMSFCKTTLKE